MEGNGSGLRMEKREGRNRNGYVLAHKVGGVIGSKGFLSVVEVG